jgi:CDP-glucose 4,6-dehydratase
MTPAFWQGRRVFLTGHTGFKGSWLALWLQDMGAQVTGYALPPSSQLSLFTLADAGRGMNSVLGDVRDLAALTLALRDARPEIVFHLAAQALVRTSYTDPVGTYATNVMGTVHLLEAVRQTGGVRAVVNVTTDKCYDNQEWDWGYRENEALGGFDPYSSSKGASELVSAAYRSSYFPAQRHSEHGVALATARAGNVIGGGDWAQDRLIPDIVTAYRLGQTVKLRNPAAIRPWQHVLEPLRGYLMLAHSLVEGGPRFAEAWNFGPFDKDIETVGHIADAMASMWGGDAHWEQDAGQHPHEAHHLKLDISKARNQLKWQPKLPLQDALRLVVQWYKLHSSGADMRATTLAQIRSYQSHEAP